MTPLTEFPHWIFDMDGTLTLPVHDFEAIRNTLNIPSGQPILEAIAVMPEAEAQRARQSLHDIEMELASLAQAQPGTLALLETLVDQGRNLGILTRNSKEIAHATLTAAGLAAFFCDEAIVGRDSCPPKPKPDGINHLLDLWGASKEQTVIVGDYLYDLQAGVAAGIRTVHFDHSGAFAWPEFAHHQVTGLDELCEMVLGDGVV